MHARLTTTLLSDGEFDDAGAVFERVLPSISELDGFKGMVILSELAGNRIVALTLWENEDAMIEADSAMDGLRDAETRPRHVESQETARFRVSGVNLPNSSS
jgi:heme-degrading monooxygenase HmoA